MATVTKSIGTSSRDFSTITLWEADLDNAVTYLTDKDAVGECYNDSAFDESFTINGGVTVSLTSITLTVASGQRHTGIAGTGARIVTSVTRSYVLSRNSASPSHAIKWLEFNFNGKNSPGAYQINFSTRNGGIYQTLIHGTTNTADEAVRALAIVIDEVGTIDVVNNIIYAINNAYGGTRLCYGFESITTATSRVRNVQNNTIHNVTTNGSGSGAANCLKFTDNSGTKVQNNLCTDAGGNTSGAKVCFNPASAASATCDHDLSSDTTASGAGSLTSKSAANQFVSTTGGSEDLHLKAGADAIGAGVDLVTTPTNVQYDIDNYDRDAGGVTWDMGADQYIATGYAHSFGGVYG